MKQHILSLTLAALLAAAPALAADWAHNDPDKASAGKVEIWDGSKTVTVDSAPAIAVAAMGGGTPIGGVVDSPLPMSDFIKVNNLNANNWRDVTWEPGKSSVDIQNTKLAKQLGQNTVNTVDKRVYTTKTYLGSGTFPYPKGSKYRFTPGSVAYVFTSCSGRNSRNDNRSCSIRHACKNFSLHSVSSDRATVTETINISPNYSGHNDKLGGCQGSPSILEVTTPTSSTLAIRQYMKVDE